MPKAISRIILILFAMVASRGSYAQDNGNYEFAPGNKVIFEDDFSQDTIGAFPSRWHVSSCNKYRMPNVSDKQFWKVQKKGNEQELLITTTLGRIDPNVEPQFYLHDSFAVEFDFTFDTSGCAEIDFYSYDNPNPCTQACLHVISSGQLRMSDFPGDQRNLYLGKYPGIFDHKAWHHFAMAYKKRAVDIYLDKYRVASIPDCKFSPSAASLSCIAPVRYKGFRITTGKDNNTFSRILTEKKFVTHAINFDVNKSTIKPESMSFIMQLAQFLKANPTVKLEIDGHTDSDGEPSANIKLSQERADEVKKQLVSAGINDNRLTTKGFGASKPLQPNTTPEGKANNRRVEFIKL